jgi:uncharacterized protein with HEPN domain
MDNDIRKLLVDALICINSIEDYLRGVRRFEEYDNNPLLQDAVERNLITIGEVVNLILKAEPGIEISNARRIVDMRNRLTHAYDAVENVMVWTILIRHLPILKQEIETIMEA